MVPKSDLQKLVEFNQKCSAFASVCQERVMLFEAYKKDADATLKAQEEQVYICKENLESEKRKQSYIIPGIALVLGFVAGFFIVK